MFANSGELELGDNKSEKIKIQQKITGTVSDESGPVPGVSVQVKGSTTGVATDFDGNYSISVTDTNSILVFSSIGYKSKEVLVGNRTTINVVLEGDIASLDEVVIVGYTSKKRGEVTGSISTLKAEDIENTSNKEVAKSLAGRVTGLIVSDRGGYPGSNNDVTLLIRGQSTLNNNAPLILIDGVQSGLGTFNQLAPQDIDNLSVLKDGAAAVYGNRAANGVIIVTTKRGKMGKPKITASTSYSVSSFSAFPDQMSSEQFAIYENEIANRNGIALPFTQTEIDNYGAGNDPINFPNTNWAELTFAKTAPETRNSISISGGTERTKYFVSADLIDREGMFASGDLGFKQSQVRSNLDVKITDDVKLSIDLSGRFAENKAPGVDAGFIYKHIYTNFPTEVGIYPNGLPARGGEDGANPVIMSSRESGFQETSTNDLRGRFAIDWKLDKITKGLSFNSYAGIRRMNNDQTSFYTPWTYYTFNQTTDEYSPQTGNSQDGKVNILRETFWKFDEALINASFRYNNTFNDVHSLSGLIAIEQQTSKTSTFYAQASNLPSTDLPYLFAGDPETAINSGTAGEDALLSYFGTLSYDYDKKYFVDLTVRRDGSSRFGPGNQFGTFYSVGGNWAIGKESFLEDVSWLDALSLRGSHAVMGNDRIPAFQHLAQFSFGNTNPNSSRPNYYVFGESGSVFNGYRTGVAPNPNITWETATMQNIAVAFSMFDNRLSGEVNFYKQKREDILVDNSGEVPDFTGVQLPDENLGRVDSHGVEVTLGWADKIGEVSYNLGFNLTQAKNEVIFLPQPANTPEALRREGSQIGSYVVAPTSGIFRDQAHVDATAVKKAGTVEGEPIYVDTNEDGVIDDGDYIRVNSSNIPEIQYGFTGGVKYKNFNFGFLLQGQAKADMLVFFDGNGSKPEHVFNQRWTPENRNARYPRAFGLNDTYSGIQNGNPDNFVGADLWLHDASFLRLKEVEIGYTLSKKKTTFADIKIFARGFNLLTMFSEVQKLGLDPEATGYNNFRGATYPSLKTYTFGLNFTF
ncbi:TonB-dependent receptor [Polaribacter sp. PL03]|uniref:SusC/RagA family TonB-linked outer membrane protein n=1 Tax=Polaribacter sp. PL03 TaxID=3088353 RepID=UPI0029D41DAF|nr:TonB-dependent receptor [Polaribacter sp. PL03]